MLQFGYKKNISCQNAVLLCSRVADWNDTLSEYFVVSQGVRQGAVLSPFLFNLYVDDLLSELEGYRLSCL